MQLFKNDSTLIWTEEQHICTRPLHFWKRPTLQLGVVCCILVTTPNNDVATLHHSCTGCGKNITRWEGKTGLLLFLTFLVENIVLRRCRKHHSAAGIWFDSLTPDTKPIWAWNAVAFLMLFRKIVLCLHWNKADGSWQTGKSFWTAREKQIVRRNAKTGDGDAISFTKIGINLYCIKYFHVQYFINFSSSIQ